MYRPEGIAMGPGSVPKAWVLETSEPLKPPRRKARDRAAKTSMLEASSAAAVQPEVIQPKHEARDPGVVWLEQEVEHGAIEYKFRISTPTPVRLQQLITQMKFRLSEGKGECFYYVGVEDDGYPRGLDPPELAASMATVSAMAQSLGAHATLLHHVPGGFGRRGALLHVTFSARDELSYTDLRIAVAGSMDAGKSTLVAVLTHGTDGGPLLDNGRGSARMSVFRHKHEIESGHTSSISQQMVGYDAAGRVLNYAGVSALLPAEISAAAAHVCTFIDMGGHEKCLKTALYGLTCMLPDYMLLCVCATARISRITREHLAVALALEVPVAVVISKADAVDDNQLQAVLAEVQQLLATAVRGSHSSLGELTAAGDGVVAPVVTGEAEAANMAAMLSQLRGSAAGSHFCQRCYPVFVVSCVSGAGLDTLHAFLSRLQPGPGAPQGPGPVISDGPVAVDDPAVLDEAWDPLHWSAPEAADREQHNSTWAPQKSRQGWSSKQELVSSGRDAEHRVHFQVLHTFDVEGVGSVVWGTLVAGVIEVGQHLMWGPNAHGGFTPVTISCIQRFHIPVKQVRPGHTATLALQPMALTTPSGRAATDSTPDTTAPVPTAAQGAADGAVADGAKRSADPVEAALLDTGYREATAAVLAAMAASSRGPEDGTGIDGELEEQMLLQAIEADDRQGPEHWRGKPAAEALHEQQDEEAEGPSWILADSGQVSDSSEASTDTDEDIIGNRPLPPRGSAAGMLAGGALAAGAQAASSSTGSFSSSAPAASKHRGGRRRASRSSSDRSSSSSGADASCDTAAFVSESSSSFFALETLALDDTATASSDTIEQQATHHASQGSSEPGTFDFDMAQFDGLLAGGAAGGYDSSWRDAMDAVPPARHSASCSSLAAPQHSSIEAHHTHRTASSRSLPACMANSKGAAALGVTRPASPTQLLGSSPPNWRKGAVLLDAAMQPKTLWAFEAVLVLLGGTWPPRGLLSGCWPPLDADSRLGLSGGGDSSPGTAVLGGSAPGGRSIVGELRSPGRASRAKRADYTYVVHCNSVRQMARVEVMQEVADHHSCVDLGARSKPGAACSSSPVQLPSSIRAAASLLQAARHSNGSGSGSGSESGPQSLTHCSSAMADVGSVVVARFRFVHRPEWLQEGARLIVRDRSDGGHFAAAGYIRALVPDQHATVARS